MNSAAAADRAAAILRDYAGRTGLAPASGTPTRYLWTDAFAVCTYLGLYETTGEPACRTRALALVEQVHAVLGRRRGDDGPERVDSQASPTTKERSTRRPGASGLASRSPSAGPPNRSTTGSNGTATASITTT